MSQKLNIEEIKQTANIVELARKLGHNPNSHNFILSIYKEEKTPSLKLYPATNTYHDFSSGKTGNVFNLYADTLGLDIKKDFVLIAKGVGVMFGISDGEVVTKPVKRKLNKVLIEVSKDLSRSMAGEEFADIYDYLLSQCPIIDKGVEYLTSRGFDAEFMKSKGIGYIPNDSYFILSKLLQNKFTLDRLINSGLFNKDGKYKGFSDSIIISYYNKDNIINNLQFRLLNNDIFKGKYLFLSSIKKSAYGLNIALNNDIRDNDSLYFTEGVFDCLMVQQIGLQGLAIPSAGDSKILTDEELRYIINKYEKLILAFDNDSAGENLTQEFGNRLYILGARKIMVKFLPDGIKDVNELILNQ